LSYYMHYKKKKFNEKQAKFIIANIVLALEFIHNNGVIHRDVRPENLVFDSDGYLKIIDFGLARPWMKNNSADTSGTPCYMAPEILLRQNHNYTSDFFAVGVILHELLAGRKPYVGPDRVSYKAQIVKEQKLLKKIDTPESWSLEGTDFINKCIARRPEARLGLNNSAELKTHVWLKEFEWRKLSRKELVSPFKPNKDPITPLSVLKS
jgi:serine/threonine protein kinase